MKLKHKHQKLLWFYGPYPCMPTFFGPLKMATFVALTLVFVQMVISSKYASFQLSVHNFQTIHHTYQNMVSK